MRKAFRFLANIYIQSFLLILNVVLYPGLLTTTVIMQPEVNKADAVGHWGDWQAIIQLCVGVLAGGIGLQWLRDTSIGEARREAARLQEMAAAKSPKSQKLANDLHTKLRRHGVQRWIDYGMLAISFLSSVALLWMSSLRYNEYISVPEVIYIAAILAITIFFQPAATLSERILRGDLEDLVRENS